MKDKGMVLLGMRGFFVLCLLSLSWGALAQTYTVNLNGAVETVPYNTGDVIGGFFPGDVVNVSYSPAIAITGGTAPSPDDVYVDVSYNSNGLGSAVVVSSADWSCDGSQAGLLFCSLLNPVPFPNPIPVLSIDFTISLQADNATPYLVSAQSGLFFSNPPPGTTINNDLSEVSILANGVGGTPEADLAVQLTPSFSAVAQGATADLAVNWSNSGPDPASNAQVDINVPAGSTGVTAYLTGAWTCTVAGNAVSCTQPNIAANDSGVFYVAFNPPNALGSYQVDASIGALESDPVPGNDTATATVVVEAPVSDVSVQTTASVSQAQPGDVVNFTVVLRDEGNSPYPSNIGLNFSIAPQQQIVSFVPAQGWLCNLATGGNLECNLNQRSVKPEFENKGTVVTGQVLDTFNISVQIAANETSSSITGTAVLADIVGQGVYTDDNPQNDSSSATIILGTAEADLSIDKQAVYTPPLSTGDAYLYRIKVTNHGPQPASGVVIEDQLPDNVELLGVSAPFGWSCTPVSGIGVLMSCSFDRTLSPPDNQIIEQQVRYLGGEVVQTTASVSSDADDPALGNNQAERIDNVVTGPQVDLVLSQTVNPAKVAPGSILTVTYVVQNTGQADASGVALDIQHGSLLSYASKVGPDWSCNAQANTGTDCSLSMPLPAGASESLSIDFQVAEIEGVADLIAEVRSQETDLTPEDNIQQERIFIGQDGFGEPFDLQLTLTSSVQNPQPGQQFLIEAALDNLGPGTAYGFVVDFVLPPGLNLLQAAGEGWQCSSTGKASALECMFVGILSVDQQTRISLDVDTVAQAGELLSVSAETYVPEGSELNAANSTDTLDLPVGRGDFLTQVGVNGGADKAEVRSGETILYTFEVNNEGSTSIEGAYVEAVLEGPARFALEQAKNWTCHSPADQTLRCDLEGVLAPGALSTVTLEAIAEPAGQSGIIRMRAKLVDGADPANVSEALQVDVTYLGLSDQDLRRLLEDAVGDDDIAGGSIGPIEEMCLAPANEIERTFCDELFNAIDEGKFTEVREVLRAVNPRAVITQTSAMVEVSSAQFRNIDARMNELRAGTGGFSMNGLNLRYGDQSLRLASLRYLMDDKNSASQSGLASPWGFFVNGTISAGDRDPTTREIGFDFSSTGITAGVDYRFSDNFVLGAALGYANFGSDDVDGGSLDTRGTTLTGYISWYPADRIYVDARLSQGWLDVDQKRSVTFSIGAVSQSVLMAGSTSANQTTLAIASGMHFSRDGLVMTPNVSMRYMTTSVDGYDERVLGLGAVRYSSFDFDSLELSAGIQMNKSISLDSGVLTPQLDANFRYETQNDGMVIEARLLGRQSPFLIRTDSPDRGYGTLGGGLVYVTNGGKQFYFTYRQLLGLEGFSQYTVNLGLRMEF